MSVYNSHKLAAVIIPVQLWYLRNPTQVSGNWEAIKDETDDGQLWTETPPKVQAVQQICECILFCSEQMVVRICCLLRLAVTEIML